MVMWHHGDMASWCCVMVVVSCCDEVGVVMLARLGGTMVGQNTHHGVRIQRTMMNDGDASFVMLLLRRSQRHGNLSPCHLYCQCGQHSFGW